MAGESLVVVDASVVVAALTQIGAEASARLVAAERIAAPELLPFEVANVVRRLALAERLSERQGGVALTALAALRVDLSPFAPLAERVWSLRSNLTAYDAAYVALAELLEAPLITLDARLAGSPGIRCRVVVPA